MIAGTISQFAVESEITHAYAEPGLRALGFFVIYIGGRRYGVREPDATLLANSFDEVSDRILRRGCHTAPFAELSAGQIAESVRLALFGENQQREILGTPTSEFSDLIYSNDLLWAPDGDAAFDDGSYVLQFDLKDRVRLIAFRSAEANLYDQATLKEIWLTDEVFYNVLKEWHDSFEAEWRAAPKVSATSDYEKG